MDRVPKAIFALLVDHPQVQGTVAQWLVSSWPAWYGREGHDGLANALGEVLRYSQADALPLGIVATVDGMPCAFGALKRDLVPGFEHAQPWLGAGYVVPSMRGLGLGLRMVGALELHAARLGFTDVWCATSTAGSLMQRAGWSGAGTSELGGQGVGVFQRVLQHAAANTMRP